MGYTIAKCKTKYGIQIRIVLNSENITKYIKTIGTGSNSLQIERLIAIAEQTINNLENNLWALEVPPLEDKPIIKLPSVRKLKSVKKYAYEILSKYYDDLCLPKIVPQLFKDLVITRIIEPRSKRATVELLKKYFDLEYTLRQIYLLKTKIPQHKDDLTKAVVKFAKEELNFNLRLAFYDVTTLYFESFSEDDLKRCGFSKDNKFNQPQLVIGLLVTEEGFPLTYEVYPGDTFEGKTFIPIIKDFKEKYEITELTVVADAAMVSQDTFDELVKAEFKYIIGARMANLSMKDIKEVSEKLDSIDQTTYRKVVKDKEEDIRYLVASYSSKRARKDKSERLKQIQKAEELLKNQKSKTKHVKFLKKVSKTKDTLEINTKLIQKAELLEGIKGYYTNLNISNNSIISIYSNLWRIEENFRVSKTDLEIRPIYHWKDAGIRFHILLNFISLVISRLIEIKEQRSIQSYINEILKWEDIYIEDTKTGCIFLIESEN